MKVTALVSAQFEFMYAKEITSPVCEARFAVSQVFGRIRNSDIALSIIAKVLQP